jgi:cysteine desulfurase family protein
MNNYGANPGRGGHKMAVETARKIYECRGALAGLFNAGGEEDVVFTSNCTASLNIALKGVLRGGEHVIISDLEHNSVLRPVHTMAKAGLITYSKAEVFEGDFERTLASFAKEIKKETRMIACTNGSNLTGVVLPVKELGALCKEKGLLFLVDAAQTAGTLEIDVRESNIDFLCMPGHKGLYGPSGTGALVTSKGGLLSPVYTGGTGSMSLISEQPGIMPDKLESGTVNISGIIGLLAGIEFIKRRGLDKIRGHGLKLMKALYSGLSQIDRVKLYTNPPEMGAHLPVLPFNIDGADSEKVAEKLDKSGFALRGGFHCAPLGHRKLGTLDTGAVRVSFSVFNTINEVEVFIKYVEKLARKL